MCRHVTAASIVAAQLHLYYFYCWRRPAFPLVKVVRNTFFGHLPLSRRRDVHNNSGNHKVAAVMPSRTNVVPRMETLPHIYSWDPRTGSRECPFHQRSRWSAVTITTYIVFCRTRYVQYEDIILLCRSVCQKIFTLKRDSFAIYLRRPKCDGYLATGTTLCEVLWRCYGCST